MEIQSLNRNMKEKLLILLMLVVVFLLGTFETKYEVYGEELIEKAEVNIPVDGTLRVDKMEESNVNDLNNGENISEGIKTNIKDKKIRKLPSTGEIKSLMFFFVGLFLIFVLLIIKGNKIEKNE